MNHLFIPGGMIDSHKCGHKAGLILKSEVGHLLCPLPSIESFMMTIEHFIAV
jgi:hypothetical protein